MSAPQTKCLVETKYAENSQTTQYTAPTGTRTMIDKFTATNGTASPVTLGVNLVPSAGAAGASNLVASLTIAAGATDHITAVAGHTLQAGDFLSAIAGTATALVIRVSGREITG